MSFNSLVFVTCCLANLFQTLLHYYVMTLASLCFLDFYTKVFIYFYSADLPQNWWRDWQIIVLAHYNFNVQSNLHDTRCITPKRVTSLRSPSPSGNIALQNKVAAMASRRQQCVPFHRREIRTSDLSFQKQTRYRLNNWSLILQSLF